MDIGKCWDFKDDEQPPYPVIEVTLSSADRKVAIDRETVRRLHVTPKGTVLVRTATGHRETPIYPVNLSQLDLAVTYTTLAIGTERSLLGRRFLENKTWLLDCKQGRFCIVTPTGTSDGD